jgi:hypothetical protein
VLQSRFFLSGDLPLSRTTDQLGDTIMRMLTWFLALSAVLAATRSALAIGASDNPSGPSTTTHYTGTEAGGFSIVENIAYDPSGGQWLKELENVGGSAANGAILSGVHVAIDEMLTNARQVTWTDWHEAVLSMNTSFPAGPDFLIDSGTMSVYRNGGLLTLGSDYSIVPVSLINEGSPADWIAVSILFNPSSSIQPSDTLRITQQIYEVFGDSNLWDLHESAVLGQYPTVPEPASLSLAILGSVGLCLLWLNRRPHRHGRSC